MVKLTSIKAEPGHYAEITAFADTKSEVTDDMTIVGLPYGVEPSMGSSVVTADGDIAFLKSDGTWNWVGDES